MWCFEDARRSNYFGEKSGSRAEVEFREIKLKDGQVVGKNEIYRRDNREGSDL